MFVLQSDLAQCRPAGVDHASIAAAACSLILRQPVQVSENSLTTVKLKRLLLEVDTKRLGRVQQHPAVTEAKHSRQYIVSGQQTCRNVGRHVTVVGWTINLVDGNYISRAKVQRSIRLIQGGCTASLAYVNSTSARHFHPGM